METEVAYFQRRASEEREYGVKGLTAPARQAHLSMADHLESLARAIEATERRRNFYVVDGGRDE